MIPYVLIISGLIAVLYGMTGLVRIFFLPLVRAHQVVFERKDDYLFYENAKGQKLLKSQKKYLMNIYITLVIVGTLVLITGFYAGFTQHGPDFWLYKKLFASEEDQRNDRINEDGQFIASDGKEYNYYILIKGPDIYFRDELCGDEKALEEKISEFDRTNTIVIYDDFAVSSAYHFVVDLLDRSGIRYIEDGN